MTESSTLLKAPLTEESWDTECIAEAATPVPRPELSLAPTWLNHGQIPGLDGLRAIAVILVLLVHSVQTAGFPEWSLLRTVAHHGQIGVDIFFVISGFLITTLLARELDRSGRLNLKRFYIRRFLRIMPAYCAVLIGVAIGQWAGKFHLESRDWIGALTYTTNFLYRPAWELGHSWSLAVEEHFYLLWPFALFVGGIVGGWRVAIGCIVGCWAARCFIALVLSNLVSHADATYYTSMAETWTFTRLDNISVGCLLALACRHDFWRGWLDRLSHPSLMLAYFVVLGTSLQLGSLAKFHLCVACSLQAVCIALIMWGFIRSEGLLRSILSHRALATIGIGSYSIYLWQQFFIHPRQSGWIHCFPQNIALALTAALISYWMIERPLNRLKEVVAR